MTGEYIVANGNAALGVYFWLVRYDNNLVNNRTQRIDLTVYDPMLTEWK
jgi:hypothetical protein